MQFYKGDSRDCTDKPSDQESSKDCKVGIHKTTRYPGMHPAERFRRPLQRSQKHWAVLKLQLGTQQYYTSRYKDSGMLPVSVKLVLVSKRHKLTCRSTGQRAEVFKDHGPGAPVWLSWLSVQLRSWSHGSWVWAPRRASCWQQGAWSLLQRLCLPLSVPPPLILFLSKINQQ